MRAEPAPSRARTPPSPHGLSIIRNTREAGAGSRNTKYNTDVNTDTDTNVNTDTYTFEGLRGQCSAGKHVTTWGD